MLPPDQTRLKPRSSVATQIEAPAVKPAVPHDSAMEPFASPSCCACLSPLRRPTPASREPVLVSPISRQQRGEPVACPSQRACAFQRSGQHAAVRQPNRTAAGDPAGRSGRVRAGCAARHLRRRRSLCRQGLLSPGRGGFRGRHHAVAGRELSRATPHSPLPRRGPDRGGRGRDRHLHRRPDFLALDGMEPPPAGTRIHPEGEAACVRPALGALAGAAGHGRWFRSPEFVPDAEIRLGAARARIPVADLHRIPAYSSPR